jgi:hypothetical protein
MYTSTTVQAAPTPTYNPCKIIYIDLSGQQKVLVYCNGQWSHDTGDKDNNVEGGGLPQADEYALTTFPKGTEIFQGDQGEPQQQQ